MGRPYYMVNCVERIVMATAGTPRQREFCEAMVVAMNQGSDQEKHEALIHATHAAESYADTFRKKRKELPAS